MKALTMSEAAFQGQVIDLARIFGWLAYHTFDSRRSEEGFPDLVLVRAPELIFAELKTEKGKLRPAQEIWLAELGKVASAVSEATSVARGLVNVISGAAPSRALTFVEVAVWRPSMVKEIEARLRRRTGGRSR